jgi:hypothetical protein
MEPKQASESVERGRMAKSKKERELFKLLRARGLRKRVARTLAGTARKKKNRRVPKAARNALGDLQAVIGVVERRVTGTSAKRRDAAAKAARTRKRQQAKRSAAAKKAARTRAKAGR